MSAHNDLRTDTALCVLSVRGNGTERMNEACEYPGLNTNGGSLRYMTARSWPRRDWDFLTKAPFSSSWPRSNP